MATPTKRRANFAITDNKTALRRHNLLGIGQKRYKSRMCSLISLRSKVYERTQRRYHNFEAITHCHCFLRWFTHTQGCYGACTSNTHPDLGLEYFCLLPKSFDFVLAMALALLLHICADFLIKLAPKVTRQMATVVRKRLLPLPIRRNATNSTLQQAQKPHQLNKRCERTFLLRQLLL